MSLICAKCGKEKMRGHAVSHAKNRTKKVWRANLQIARIMVDGVKQKMVLCTRCIKQVRKAEKSRLENKKVAQVEQVGKVEKVEKVEQVKKEKTGKVKKTSKVVVK